LRRAQDRPRDSAQPGAHARNPAPMDRQWCRFHSPPRRRLFRIVAAAGRPSIL